MSIPSTLGGETPQSTPDDTLPVGRVVAVQVGMPRPLTDGDGKRWRSAIVKQAVEGPVRLEGENLVGDYQANRKYHGGPSKAICFFSADRYPALSEMLGLPFGPGAFGENLTIEGLTDDDICIGDTLAIGGDVLLQVSQPRQPCASIAKRWNLPTLPRRMEETGWTGFYCRIVRPGELQAGDTVAIVARPNRGWTIARANAAVYTRPADKAELAALRAVPLLSDEWTGMLDRRLGRAQETG